MKIKMNMEITVNGKVIGGNKDIRINENKTTHSTREEDELIQLHGDNRNDETNVDHSFDVNFEGVTMNIKCDMEADCTMKEYIEAVSFSIKDTVKGILEDKK